MTKTIKANTIAAAAALDYATQRGWLIFPARFVLNDKTGKWEKKSWKSAKSSNGRPWGMTKDPDEIRRDFAKPNRSAVGIPTGAVNNIFVIEADTPEGHDVDGLASLKQLETEHGALPNTLIAESPSGSRHHYFKHPGNDLKVRSTTSELGPGIDVKGDGGMVIAPPSLRPGKGNYRWLDDTPIADAPDWLINSSPPTLPRWRRLNQPRRRTRRRRCGGCGRRWRSFPIRQNSDGASGSASGWQSGRQRKAARKASKRSMPGRRNG
jgi:hypothetical protein